MKPKYYLSFINKLKAKGYSIIYISHRMDEIFRNIVTELRYYGMAVILQPNHAVKQILIA